MNVLIVFVTLFIVHAYSAKEFKLVWSPEANKDGLKAFEGIEDEPAQAHKVKHIVVEGNNYRFNMHVQDRDASPKPDRQRQEVKGMVANGKMVRMQKGDTWKFTYSMFIPSTLKGTSSFTHIAQMKTLNDRPEDKSPICVLSLDRKGDQELITAQVLRGRNVIGTTPLKPLHDKWVDVAFEYYVHDVQGYANLTLSSDGKVVLQGKKENVQTFLHDEVRPKWGIYRSLDDTKNIINTYLLLTKMRAYKLQ